MQLLELADCSRCRVSNRSKEPRAHLAIASRRDDVGIDAPSTSPAFLRRRAGTMEARIRLRTA
jgi:hypothetical protein